MKKLLVLCFIIPQFLFSQDDKKIDSVFQHYFKVVEIELNQDKLINYPNLIKEVDLGNGEKGIVNKYYGDAVLFFTKITKIEGRIDHKAQNLVFIIDIETLNKWKRWYGDYRYKLSWHKRKKKPKISFFRRLFIPCQCKVPNK